MKICGRRNVRKHKEIKGGDKYVTLDISLKFDSLYKMKNISSESKQKWERLGNGLITSLGFRIKVRPQKYKKSRYAIGNVSKKDLSKIIRKLEKYDKLPYEKKRPKTWAYWQLLLPSKTAYGVYDEIWLLSCSKHELG